MLRPGRVLHLATHVVVRAVTEDAKAAGVTFVIAILVVVGVAVVRVGVVVAVVLGAAVVGAALKKWAVLCAAVDQFAALNVGRQIAVDSVSWSLTDSGPS